MADTVVNVRLTLCEDEMQALGHSMAGAKRATREDVRRWVTCITEQRVREITADFYAGRKQSI